MDLTKPSPVLPERPPLPSCPQSSNKMAVFVIDNLPIRVEKIRAVFGDFYDLQVFSDGRKALDEMQRNPPVAVLSDDHCLHSCGFGIHRTKCNSTNLKHIPFFITSDELNGPYVSGNGNGATDYFLKRPVNIEHFFDLVAQTTNKQVEDSWKTLPKQTSEALRTSADGFDEIAKAVANNTPLDKSKIITSCNPLVACVQDGQTKHLLQGLKNHQSFIYTHSMRVAIFMCAFGKAYSVSESESVMLTSGGFMHDIGEILLPHNLIYKHGRLTHEELVLMRHHVEETEAIIASIKGISPVIQAIAELHHERLDGTGYPHGLQGSEINELGRMIAIADVFAALTDVRPHRSSLEATAALDQMQQRTEVFDQGMLQLFREIVED